ncbi:uncharacterized protein LOC130926623 [Corythoichthys intestinalis]|uniref:uncharacterized protein LOC130926623 n=1 Tax=Corythoichthys intestinalis TaxID=161448 RepID=UPI0025A61089|nr:uncharacterized protein LOC130926623 [Corythoichthys intestinalis]
MPPPPLMMMTVRCAGPLLPIISPLCRPYYGCRPRRASPRGVSFSLARRFARRRSFSRPRALSLAHSGVTFSPVSAAPPSGRKRYYTRSKESGVKRKPSRRGTLFFSRFENERSFDGHASNAGYYASLELTEGTWCYTNPYVYGNKPIFIYFDPVHLRRTSTAAYTTAAVWCCPGVLGLKSLRGQLQVDSEGDGALFDREAERRAYHGGRQPQQRCRAEAPRHDHWQAGTQGHGLEMFMRTRDSWRRAGRSSSGHLSPWRSSECRRGTP